MSDSGNKQWPSRISYRAASNGISDKLCVKVYTTHAIAKWSPWVIY